MKNIVVFEGLSKGIMEIPIAAHAHFGFLKNVSFLNFCHELSHFECEECI